MKSGASLLSDQFQETLRSPFLVFPFTLKGKTVTGIECKGAAVLFQCVEVVCAEAAHSELQKLISDAVTLKEMIDIELYNLAAADLNKAANQTIVINIGAAQQIGILRILFGNREHLKFAEGVVIIPENRTEVDPFHEDKNLRDPRDIAQCGRSDVFHADQGLSWDSSRNRGILVRSGTRGEMEIYPCRTASVSTE